MAITGVLITACADFYPNTCEFRYGVDRFHEQFGALGNQGFFLRDANTVSNVVSFIHQILPVLESEVGIPLTLPTDAVSSNSSSTITGKIISARAAFVNGTEDNLTGCQLTYTVELFDQQLTFLNARSYTVSEPSIKQNVRAYVEQMLPGIEIQTGMPVTLPPALSI